MIKIKDAVIKYGKKTVVKGVSLNIQKGDVVALAGQNGAGKTSFLKAIIGEIKLSSGSILSNGSIGWMPENAKPDPKLSVTEYLTFCASLKLSSLPDSLVSDCGLEEFRHSRCSELSKGQMQRVLLAGALIGDSSILVLDEPSAGLDPLFQVEMIDLIKRVATKCTVIISTHNISEIKKLASKVIVLRNGELTYYGSTEGNKYYEYF